jgi:hypothetical protein
MRYLPAVLIALLAFAPAAEAGSTYSCSAKGSTTVAKNSYARVYTRPVSRGDETQRLYACRYASGMRYLLDRASDDFFSTSVEFGQVKLSGRFVAWEHVVTDFSCRAACPPEYDQRKESIVLADLRRRRKTTIRATPRAGSLSVDRSGTVNWVDDPTGEPRSYQR